MKPDFDISEIERLNKRTLQALESAGPLNQAHERGIGGELIPNCRTSPPP
jgi:hypothetical protein